MGRRKLMIAAAVGLAGIVSVAAYAEKDEKDEAPEVSMKLADCPQAVQKTVTREAEGSAVSGVDKEEKHGKTVYEADATIDSKNYEIKVADDGTLLSKKLDDDKDESDKDKD
jgi:hypothetical protein